MAAALMLASTATFLLLVRGPCSMCGHWHVRLSVALPAAVTWNRQRTICQPQPPHVALQGVKHMEPFAPGVMQRFQQDAYYLPLLVTTVPVTIVVGHALALQLSMHL